MVVNFSKNLGVKLKITFLIFTKISKLKFLKFTANNFIKSKNKSTSTVVLLTLKNFSRNLLTIRT